MTSHVENVTMALAAIHGHDRSFDELELIAQAAVAAVEPAAPVPLRAKALHRGCEPLELTKEGGLMLFDDERAVLKWAQRADDDATNTLVGERGTRRGDVIAGVLHNVATLRRRRLEAIVHGTER